MNITGKIIAVLEQKTGVSERGSSWMKQDFVIETLEQYPRRMFFNVFGEDKLREMNIKMGEILTVHFDVNARLYNGNWYNDIRVWKAEHHGTPTPVTPEPVIETNVPNVPF